MKPTYQATSVSPISRPRSRAGANSDISGQPTEYSAPIAMPISSRTKNSCQAESTKNCSDRTDEEQRHVRHEQRLTAELVGGPARRAASRPGCRAVRTPRSGPPRAREKFSSSAIVPITVPDDPEDVAVDEHPADQDGDQPDHEASLERLRGGVRLGRCVLYRGHRSLLMVRIDDMVSPLLRARGGCGKRKPRRVHRERASWRAARVLSGESSEEWFTC